MGSNALANAFKLRDFVSATQPAFGAKRDGVTNDTAALLAFFNYCIDHEVAGHIPAGTYLITKGVLAFDTPYVDKAWPNITTDGADLVEFLATTSTNAPFISITNGTATGSGFEGWLGGSLGGITFRDTSGATAANAHGLLLRGMLGTKFGYMRGESLRASLIYIDQKLFGTTNPDPYNVALCTFEGADANSCEGFAFNNDNYLGLTICTIKFVRAANCLNSNGGGFRGFGSTNTIEFMTMGSCKGWALDDRTDNTGGASNRFTIEKAEIDNVEFGIRSTFGFEHDLKGVRFNHRYQTTPNSSANYWPRTALALGGNALATLYESRVQMVHHIIAGGVLGDVGTFVDCNNIALGNAVIDQLVLDDAGFAFTNSNYYTNVSSSSQLVFKKQGQVINDTNIHPGAYLRGGTGTALTIGNNPITTGTIGTPTFTVASAGHGVVANQVVVLQGSAAVDGIPAAEINRGHCVTSVTDANNFVCTVETNCTAGAVTGGGAGVTGRKDQAFLNITGFGGPKCKVAFATELYDRAANHSATLYEYTVPFTGTYKIQAQLSVTGLAAGNQVRLGIYQNIHTAPNSIAVTAYRCQGANRETVHCAAVTNLAAGAKVSVQCDQGSAAAVAPSIVGSEDCSWSIEPIGL